MIVLYTFFVIYNPPLLPFSTLHICTIIALFSMLRHWSEYKKHFGTRVIHSILFLSIVMVYMSIVIFAGSGSFLELYRIGAIAFELFPCSCFISYMCSKKGFPIDKAIIQAAFIEGVIATIAFVFPPVQSFLINGMVQNGYSDVYLSFTSYRLYGLSYSMLYGMPTVNAMIGIYAIYYAIKNKVIYIFMAAIILLSALINARVAIIPIVLGLIYLVVILYKGRIITKNIIKTLVVVALAALSITFVYKTISENIKLNDWLLRGFDDIKALLLRNDNGSAYYSYYSGKETWQLPGSFFNVLFGTGKRVIRGNSLLQSDIGYVNDIWWGGIVYSALVYGFTVHELRIVSKKRNHPELFAFGIILLVILAVVNIKGNVIGLNEISSLITILYVCALDNIKWSNDVMSINPSINKAYKNSV